MTSAKALPERMMTFERWQHLLEKAWQEGVVLAPHPTNPTLARTFSRTQMANNRVVLYTVSVYGCSCPARGDCKHRALYLFERPALLPLAVLPSTPPVSQPSEGGESADRESANREKETAVP
jgi:hypothetical protein